MCYAERRVELHNYVQVPVTVVDTFKISDLHVAHLLSVHSLSCMCCRCSYRHLPTLHETSVCAVCWCSTRWPEHLPAHLAEALRVLPTVAPSSLWHEQAATLQPQWFALVRRACRVPCRPPSACDVLVLASMLAVHGPMCIHFACNVCMPFVFLVGITQLVSCVQTLTTCRCIPGICQWFSGARRLSSNVCG
jgi:hypothetical protein